MSVEHLFTDGVDATSGSNPLHGAHAERRAFEGAGTVAGQSSRSEANTDDLEAEAFKAAEAVEAAEAMLKAAKLRAASVAAKARSSTGDAVTSKEQAKAKTTNSKAGGKKKHVKPQASPVPQHGQAEI